MKTFKIKKDGKQVLLECDTNTTKFEAIEAIIGLFARHMMDKGKGEDLKYLLQALLLGYESMKEWEKFNKEANTP